MSVKEYTVFLGAIETESSFFIGLCNRGSAAFHGGVYRVQQTGYVLQYKLPSPPAPPWKAALPFPMFRTLLQPDGQLAITLGETLFFTALAIAREFAIGLWSMANVAAFGSPFLAS